MGGRTNDDLHPDPRATFRETLAQAAEQARLLLPQAVNGRIAKAVALVLQGDVQPQEDGTVTVFSATDATRRYILQGSSCTCSDYERRQAPEGWCAHKIAANLQRSVERVLARSTPVESEAEVVLPEEMEVWSDNDIEAPLPEEVEAPSPLPCPAPLPEARSSANVRLQVCGHEVQITLRDHDEAALMVRLTALIHGYGPPPPPPPPPVEPTPQCPQHGALKKSTKGQGWYCPHKVTDDTWCPSKGK